MKVFKLKRDEAGEFFNLVIKNDRPQDVNCDDEVNGTEVYAFAMPRHELEQLAREILGKNGLGGTVERRVERAN